MKNFTHKKDIRPPVDGGSSKSLAPVCWCVHQIIFPPSLNRLWWGRCLVPTHLPLETMWSESWLGNVWNPTRDPSWCCQISAWRERKYNLEWTRNHKFWDVEYLIFYILLCVSKWVSMWASYYMYLVIGVKVVVVCSHDDAWKKKPMGEKCKYQRGNNHNSIINPYVWTGLIHVNVFQHNWKWVFIRTFRSLVAGKLNTFLPFVYGLENHVHLSTKNSLVPKQLRSYIYILENHIETSSRNAS